MFLVSVISSRNSRALRSDEIEKALRFAKRTVNSLVVVLAPAPVCGSRLRTSQVLAPRATISPASRAKFTSYPETSTQCAHTVR